MGHRPALLWLRPGRAALYRRVALCQPLGNADAVESVPHFAEYNSAIRQIENQSCSACKTLAALCLSLPARNERGESRREGKLIRGASSPRPSPPFLRRRGRENTAALSKQIFCRTQLIKNLRCANRFVPLKIWTNVPSFHKPFSTRRFEAELRCTDTLAAAARRRLPSRRSRQDPAGAILPLRPSSHRIDPLGSASQVGE